ncbi:hypothetical protein RRG08_000198 [Elysia crispata]|uniref:Uncharacterized protein n=1 Tax=Elysia crispata TaxID=231223 RepID=A0AAE0YUZ5_9GAST|nr:hypothetical protein RRG08_000198 [Elysia crispata]
MEDAVMYFLESWWARELSAGSRGLRTWMRLSHCASQTSEQSHLMAARTGCQLLTACDLSRLSCHTTCWLCAWPASTGNILVVRELNA